MMAVVQNPLLLKPARALPKCVAILGAGTIGPDIGYYLKSEIPGLKMYLVDVEQTKLDEAVERFAAYAKKGLARRKLTESQAAGVTENLIATLDYAAIADADWVIEAATEDLNLKRRIFATVESIVGDDTIITSNTSSLPANKIFADIEHKQRTTITHFFTPAFRNPAVEVIQWEEGDPELVDYLRRLFCTTGKVPLVTADVPCFMLDRIFDNWCNESGHLTSNASAAEIDSIACEFAQVGPFFVINMANGNPIIVATSMVQADAEGEHYRPAPVFRSVDRWNTVAMGVKLDVPTERAAQIRDRLLGILFSQSVDILDRNIGTAADLDLGCYLALGFKRGPLTLMRDLGEPETERILQRFARERPGMPMPQRPLNGYQGYQRHVLTDDLPGGVKLITIRRPEALNALHDGITDEILSVIKTHEPDPAVKGFVITGYGQRAFSAGADIGRFPSVLGDAQASAQYARDTSRLLVHLDAMQKPVVAALNGMALGGGLELAMRCHTLVAVRDTWLQFPEITLGIVPGIGAMVVPYRRWPGAADVFHTMLRGAAKLSAEKGHELAMIDALADDSIELFALAAERVQTVAQDRAGITDGPVRLPPFEPGDGKSVDGQLLSGQVLGILEQAIIDAAVAESFAAALEIGYQAFGASACTDAAREGITSFQQRRKPDFAKTG